MTGQFARRIAVPDSFFSTETLQEYPSVLRFASGDQKIGKIHCETVLIDISTFLGFVLLDNHFDETY